MRRSNRHHLPLFRDIQYDMSNRDIYHRDFQLKPWWWEAYNPNAMELADVPRNADVAVIGAGYAGLACALELARHGRSCVVFDAEQPGFGGSTRNGGMVSGGRNVGKRYREEFAIWPIMRNSESTSSKVFNRDILRLGQEGSPSLLL